MIDILGAGLTLSSYDWGRNSYKWGLSQCRELYNGDINLFFALHKGQSSGLDNEIGLESYPLNEIIKWSGCNYFTNSVAYMIAYALYTGQKEINIFGVDMDHKTEYAYERPCIAYWIGYGRAIGAKIKISCGLSEPAFNYGYDIDKQKAMIEIFTIRKDSAKQKTKETQGREKDQWIGAMVAYNKIIDFIRS